MEPFVRHTGTAVPLAVDNVDTDQIIPAAYMKRLTRTGFADGLFRRWRDRDPDFALNRPEFAGASILVAGADFGIGSSREHAVWALRDFGFRVVIAESLGDIFAVNATKNGLLAFTLDPDEIDGLRRAVSRHPATRITVDLDAQVVRHHDLARDIAFRFDPRDRYQLLHGLDDIALTLAKIDLVARYETRRRAWLPVTDMVGGG
ncbi:3-isopropylmalate dehydratase small subunit [Pseudonocardia acaciae]|uniref:3-isopropylmalate dehydratase small subunit n=1 Tax=Pseudonocardia acaciae TaxID=551276 RepID=UPI00048B9F0C|nr:3-isopropylmalate dehydratase small subunit [Pseudonocardia acaciae]